MAHFATNICDASILYFKFWEGVFLLMKTFGFSFFVGSRACAAIYYVIAENCPYGIYLSVYVHIFDRLSA